MGVSNWPRTLAWSEFNEVASAPSGVKEDAQISVIADLPASGIELERDGRALKVKEIDVPLVVEASDTWVVKDKKSASLLSHEQGHFDIAGLVSWQLYRKVMAARANSGSELQRLLNQHVAWARRKLEGLSGSATKDGKYDLETKHGLDTKEQKRWKDLIAEAMTHNNRALPDP